MATAAANAVLFLGTLGPSRAGGAGVPHPSRPDVVSQAQEAENRSLGSWGQMCP